MPTDGTFDPLPSRFFSKSNAAQLISLLFYSGKLHFTESKVKKALGCINRGVVLVRAWGGGLSLLVNAEKEPISTFAKVFCNVLRKSPLCYFDSTTPLDICRRKFLEILNFVYMFCTIRLFGLP